MTSPDLLQAALGYAARGWAVIPIWAPRPDGSCACENPECDRIGKHPLGSLVPHGVRDATKDPDEIRRWWAKHPDANLGLATGASSGFDVLDVDGDIGEESLRALEKEYAELPQTIESLTGGGGRHVLFAYRTGLKNAVRFAPGLDVRTTGGYIVAPPSHHASGRSYAWDCTLDPEEADLAPWPAWLAEKVTGSSSSQRRTEPAASSQPGIPEHQRNTTLTSMAGGMRRRGHTESEIRAALLCTNAERCRPPLAEAEVERIAHSVASYAAPSELATAPLTDLGNRDRLVALHGLDIRYHEATGWLVWSGTHWVDKADHLVMERAAETIRLIYAEVTTEKNETRRTALSKHAVASEGAGRIRAMVDLAKSHAAIRIQPEDLDGDAWALCVLNGVIDLRTGDLRPHRREEYITRLVPIVYDPKARAPRWERFLTEVLPDADVCAFLRRFVGYLLTGDTSEQVFLILHGAGSNGKSVLTGIWLALLGPYAVSPPFATFLQRRPDAPTNDLMDLKGARLALASEPDAGAKLSESTVKRITGQDLITARRHYQEFQTFKPVCKVVLVGNHRPRIRGTDHAIWRRVLLVQFGVIIPDDRCDGDLPRKLKDELPGILAWAVCGCLEWQREGLRPPEAIRAATERYRTEEDHFGRFLDDTCVLADNLWVTPKALRDAYIAWCEREGEDHPIAVRTMGSRLGDRNFTATKRHGKRIWMGLGLAGADGHEAPTATPTASDSGQSEFEDTERGAWETGTL